MIWPVKNCCSSLCRYPVGCCNRTSSCSPPNTSNSFAVPPSMLVFCFWIAFALSLRDAGCIYIKNLWICFRYQWIMKIDPWWIAWKKYTYNLFYRGLNLELNCLTLYLIRWRPHVINRSRISIGNFLFGSMSNLQHGNMSLTKIISLRANSISAAGS
jgi:hypothetical protein